MTSVEIPQSVTQIGELAFCGWVNHIITKEGKMVNSFYKCDNLVIYSPTGSYVIEFAKKNGIKYVAI